MIYQPYLIYDLYRIFGASIVRAIQVAALDYAINNNQPWSYYLGVALGYAALATGIKGAAATLHIIATGFDQVFFKSPSGSLARVFIDGILRAELNLFDGVESWQSYHFDFGSPGSHTVEILNFDVAPGNSSGIAWLALGAATADGGIIYGATMATVDIVSYQLADASGTTSSEPFFLPAGAYTLAQLQSFSDGMAPILDNVTQSKILSARVDLALSLPSGLKAAAVADSNQQAGGLITFSAAATRYKYGQWTPNFIIAGFTGDVVNRGNPLVAAFTGAMLAGVPGFLFPVTDKDGNALTASVSGVKSFRKTGKRQRK